MMKKNMKKKSTARKLLPAAGMLAVSASMLATSTYAWFTMNKVVEVTGMELKTKVGSNLLICSDNVEEHYSSATLQEGRMALLEPVSSVNGTTGSFYYTVNATARGQKDAGATVTGYNEDTDVANAVAGKYSYDKAFNGAYGIHTTASPFEANKVQMIKANASADPPVSGQDGAAYGYIDYVFYIKATSDTAAQKLQMTECNMLYGGNAIGAGTTAGVDIDRAWRVGVFVTKLDAATQGGKGNSGTYASIAQIDPASAAANQKGILALSNATYFTQNSSVEQAQATASALGDVVNFKNGADGTTGVILDTIANSGTTAYYKVLVRAWLEGEDNTCNSETYAKLTNNWALNCKFELETTDKAVKKLNSDTSSTANTAVTQEAVTSPIEVATTAAATTP